jgi:hypothetical protein
MMMMGSLHLYSCYQRYKGWQLSQQLKSADQQVAAWACKLTVLYLTGGHCFAWAAFWMDLKDRSCSVRRVAHRIDEMPAAAAAAGYSRSWQDYAAEADRRLVTVKTC